MTFDQIGDYHRGIASGLTRNGYRLEAPEGEPAIILEAVAASEIEEAGLAVWFRRRTKKFPG